MISGLKSNAVLDEFWTHDVEFGIHFLHVLEKAARGIASEGKG
jgi:hypothetical protein